MNRHCFQLRASASRRGTILVMVMWIAFGLVSVVVFFGTTMGFEYRAADNSFGGAQADQAVEGARRYVKYLLANPTSPGVAPSLENAEYVAEEVLVGQATFWLLGRDPNADLTVTEPTFGLIDEASKINLNMINENNIEILEKLLEQLDMDITLAGAIVDWRDEDETPTESGGAESMDYQMLEEPYNAKNADYETPEELSLVLGIDSSILYGEDRNRNGILDPNEDDGDTSWPDDDRDGTLDPGLLEYVTTFTREKNTREDGSARINLKGENSEQNLRNALSEAGMDPQRIGELLAPMQPLRDIDSVLEFYVRAQDAQITADEFTTIEPLITFSNAPYLVGRINIAKAPLIVLASLPGMDVGLAQQLVSAREGLEETELESLAWVAQALDPSVAEQIGPFVTTRSYQFTADVTAMGHDYHGYRRALFVYDVEDEVRVIYRRDLTRLGFGLGETCRMMTISSNTQ